MNVESQAHDSTTFVIQGLLRRLATGDAAAKEELLDQCYRRVERLSRRMLHGSFARLDGLEQTNDVVQDVYHRLLVGWDSVIHQSDGTPRTDVGEFLSCAARLIHEVLIEYCRKHFGRTGGRPKLNSLDVRLDNGDTSQGPFDPGTDTHDPGPLALLTDFHRAVEELPEHHRRVVYLHWYQELSHEEVGQLLNIGESTSRKYRTQARLQLAKRFDGNPFDWFK